MWKCVCGYVARDEDDLEEHILAASRIDDGQDHAENNSNM